MKGLWIALLVIGGSVVFTHRAFGGTRVSVAGDALNVEMVGLDKLWALKPKLELALNAVTAVHVEDPAGLRGGLRMPGTSIPRWITAGRYVNSGHKSFWNVHRARRVLVVDLEHSPYDQLVLEVNDPEAVAETLRASIARSR